MKRQYNFDIRKLVLDNFTAEQKEHPFNYVSKKQVYSRIMKAIPNKEERFSYRTMERVFEKLVNNKKIIVTVRGKYWLPENLTSNLENQKKISAEAEKKVLLLQEQKKRLLIKNKNFQKEKEIFSSTYDISKHFLDSLIYCESEEDWNLLETYFTRMLQNKYELEYEQEQVEAYEDEQETKSKILHELEKNEMK